MKAMEYRILPHGGEPISIIGLGTSSIQVASEQEIEETVRYALERGINYFDMASAEAKPFAAYGRALKGNRDKVYFQIHFGADYAAGTYGWTTNLDTIKRSVDWQLHALQTDYICRLSTFCVRQKQFQFCCSPAIRCTQQHRIFCSFTVPKHQPMNCLKAEQM